MKKTNISCLVCFLLAITLSVTAQVTTPKPDNFKSITDGGTGSQPILNTIMHDLLDDKITYKSNLKTIGSPYLKEKYQIATLFYKEELQDHFYIRHNILNDEIELKKSMLPNEQPKALIRDPGIKLVLEDGKAICFKKYRSKKGDIKRGFIYTLNDSATYTIYKAIHAKFSEGHTATSSMVKEVPHRFSHFTSYYFTSIPQGTLYPLPSNYKKFLQNLKPEIQKKLKAYIKENGLNFKDENEIKLIFDYLNSIL